MPEIRKDISGIFASGMQTARAEEITIRSSLLKTSRVNGRLLVEPRPPSLRWIRGSHRRSVSEPLFSRSRSGGPNDATISCPSGPQPTRVEGMSNVRTMAAPLTMPRFIGLPPTLPEEIGTVVRPVTMRCYVRHRPLCEGGVILLARMGCCHGRQV